MAAGGSSAATATLPNGAKGNASPGASSALIESARQQLYGRKESAKIADKFLVPSANDEDLDARLPLLDDPADALQDLDPDQASLRAPAGGILANEFDLAMLNEDDLLREMAEIENQAKTTMEELAREQEEFEQIAQRAMKKTMKKIRASIKSSIRQSRATISKRKTQRETMKKLQADASGTGRFGKSGLTNEKCGNCDKYLEYIE